MSREIKSIQLDYRAKIVALFCAYSLVASLPAFSADSKSCEVALRATVDEKSKVYYSKWDPRRYYFKNKVEKAVREKLPNLSTREPDEITKAVYEYLRDFEDKRMKIPPKGYIYWAINFSGPAVGALAAYKYVPPENQALVGIVMTYVMGKVLDPLGSAVQEKWNGWLRNHATKQGSVFQATSSPVNNELKGVQDRATGAQSPWMDAGDGKLRAIEAIITKYLDRAERAIEVKDRQKAVKSVAHVATDYLTRWTYLGFDQPVFIEKVRDYLSKADKELRDEIIAEVLNREQVKKDSSVSRLTVEQLLDAWMPHLKK